MTSIEVRAQPRSLIHYHAKTTDDKNAHSILLLEMLTFWLEMVLEMVLDVMYVFTVLSVLAFRGGGGELISMTLNLTS